jgi:hypothetical protein
MSQKGLIASWKFQKQRLNVGTQLVTNGDMELNSNWTDYGTPTTSEQSAVKPYRGTYSWHVVADGNYEGITSDTFAVTEGKYYRVSVWVWLVSGTTVEMSRQSGRLQCDTTSTTTTGEWQKIEWEGYGVSTGTEQVRVHNRTAGVYEAYIDSFFVTELPVPDLTPQGNEMSILGAIFTTDHKSLSDSALSFDGVGNYALGSDAGFPEGNSSRSFSSWVKVNSTQLDLWATLFSYGPDTLDEGFIWNIDDDSSSGKPFIGKYGLNSGMANTAVDDDAWHHIAAVITQNGATDVAVAFYLDGLPDGTSTLAGIDTTLSGKAVLGANMVHDDQFYRGWCDEIKMWNRALSADEVLAEYNTYQPDGALNTGSLQKGLVAHFPLRSEYNKVGDVIVSENFNADDGGFVGTAYTWDTTDKWTVTNPNTSSKIAKTGLSFSVGETYVVRALLKAPTGAVINKQVLISNASAVWLDAGDIAAVLSPTPNGTEQQYEWLVTVSSAVTSPERIGIGRYSTVPAGDYSVDQVDVKPLLSADITPQGNHAEVWGADVQAELTDFNGTSDFIDCGDNFAFTSSFLISLWLNSDDTTVGRFIARDGAGGDRGWYLAHVVGGKARILVSGDGTTSEYLTTDNQVFTPGQWHHLACLYNHSAQQLKIYVDSVEITASTLTGTVPSSITPSSVNTLIGKRYNDIEYFEGNMDSIRIYEKADEISDVAAFVLALYNKGRS